MDLRNYLQGIRRWLWLGVLAPLAAVVAFGVSSLLPPVYEANVSVLVKPAQANQSQILTGPADQLARTYAQLMTEPPLLAQVARDLHLNASPGALAGAVKVGPVAGTTLLNVAVQSHDRAAARDIANTLVSDFIANTKQLNESQVLQVTGGIRSQTAQVESDIQQELAQIQQLQAQKNLSSDQQTELLRLQQQLIADRSRDAQLLRDLADLNAQASNSTDTLVVVAPATLPQTPVAPNKRVNALLAFVAGLLIALGLVFLLELADQSIKSEEALHQRTGLTALARIPAATATGGPYPEVVALGGDSKALEGYNELRTNLLFSSVERECRTIVVTSPSPGDGKSRTSANLAVVLAQAGHRTLLVDADFRRPSQSRIFGGKRGPGLTDLIMHRASEAEVMLSVAPLPDLWILPAGTIPPNPSELLGSGRMRAVQAAMRQKFAYIIVDTPPVNAVTDPAVVAAFADAVLMVALWGNTTYAAMNHARHALGRVGSEILGVVLNRVDSSAMDYNYGYHYTAAGPSTPPVKEMRSASKAGG